MEYININDNNSIYNYFKLNQVHNFINNDSNMVYDYNTKIINPKKSKIINVKHKKQMKGNKNGITFKNKNYDIPKNIKKNSSSKIARPLNIKSNLHKNNSFIINQTTKKISNNNKDKIYLNNSKNKKEKLKVRNSINNSSYSIIFSSLKSKNASPIRLINDKEINSYQNDNKNDISKKANSTNDIFKEQVIDMKMQLYNTNLSLDKFTEVINNLKNENQKLLKEKNFYEEKINYLNSLLYQKNNRFKNFMTHENFELQDNKNNLYTNNNKYISNNTDINENKKNNQIEELFIDYRNEKNNLIGLKEIHGELLLLREENHYLKNECKNIINEKTQISINNNEKIKILIQDNKDIKNLYKQLEQEHKKITFLLNNKNKELEIKNEQFFKLKGENDILKNEIKKSEEIIKQLNNKMNSYSNIDNNKDYLHDTSIKLEEYKKNKEIIRDLKNKIDSLTKENEKEKLKYKDYNNLIIEIQNIRKENELIKNKNNDIINKNKELTEEFEKNKKEIILLNEENIKLNKSNKEINLISDTINKLKDEINEKSKQEEKNKEIINNLKEQLSNIKKDKENKYNDINSKKLSLENKISELEKDNKELQEKIINNINNDFISNDKIKLILEEK